VKDEDLARAAIAVRDAVSAGDDFSKALEAQGEVFSRSVVTMARAGEAAGMLDVAMKHISEGLEDGSFPLPGTAGKMEPGVAATALSFRVFGRLLTSGVPILAVTEILADEAPTQGIADVWRGARKAIMEGVSLSEALQEFPEVMPERVVDAVRWAERAGRLDGIAERIAEALEKGETASLPGAPPAGSDLSKVEELVRNEDAAPVIKLVNLIILEALKAGASDIRIEPYANRVDVRYRIDGAYAERISPPKKMHNAVVSRIKIMANLDIAERRKPQDGRIELNVRGEPFNLRVSVMPTVHGELVVLRILRPEVAVKPLEEIVTVPADLDAVRRACERKSGLILVTGLAGSGKSTLLYSMVNEIKNVSKAIVMIEDPVCYAIDGIQQVNVNHKAGVTFPVALRSALRLDADVIVVGDVRDVETAELALKAAMTGHLVMAVMHTPTPVDTVTRLIDMGLPAFEVNTALAMVVSQRLVRKLCPKCRVEAKLGAADLPGDVAARIHGADATVFSPVGCADCGGLGYKGRAAVQEVLVPDESFRKALSSGAGKEELHAAAKSAGMTTMLERALDLAAKGVTSVEEAVALGREA